jgi:hypothetical protein
MAWITPVEAGIESGFSVELILKLTKHCPKTGHDRKVKSTTIDDLVHVDQTDFRDYRRWLREPWPLAPKATRPHMPAYIKDDVRAESHYACAICLSTINGEVAHIDASAKTYDNSPENLLLLCPNHHTEYDLGFKPSTNVSRDAILAAKQMRQSDRRRSLKFEGNVVAALKAVLRTLEGVEAKAVGDIDASLREAYEAETRTLVASVSELSSKAHEAASQDRDFTEADAFIMKKAPELYKAAQLMAAANPTEGTVRYAASEVIAVAAPMFQLDEVDCPHCRGRGQTGLMGDLCAYCRGACVVTAAEVEAYDPADIDEVDCPHCRGRGQTGLVGDICAYCNGRQQITAADAEAYDPADIDEVDCPHCRGRGQTGLAGDTCAYCSGRQQISQEEEDAYDPEAIDEVDCPHCGGQGQSGLNGATCAYCNGSQQVSQADADAYDPADIDEVQCPHCHGSGQKGFSGEGCRLCNADQVVSRAVADKYRCQRGDSD